MALPRRAGFSQGYRGVAWGGVAQALEKGLESWSVPRTWEPSGQGRDGPPTLTDGYKVPPLTGGRPGNCQQN